MAYMEVLLSEDVDNLGHRGQIVRVRAGYGRNYLLPQGLAMEATAGNKRMIDEQKRILNKREHRERTSAEQQGGKLNGVELAYQRKVGEHGILYGSVTAMDIAESLKGLGYEIERRRIGLKEPIKSVGEYDVVIKLHRDITPAIKVVVRKEGAPEGKAEAAAPEPETAAQVANEDTTVESRSPEEHDEEAPEE
ncbi:MAG TPA: 50S ribosomal protein L9 [Blastocatellia bacterium]